MSILHAQTTEAPPTLSYNNNTLDGATLTTLDIYKNMANMTHHLKLKDDKSHKFIVRFNSFNFKVMVGRADQS